MANVIVALTPCVVASAIIFGLRALLVTAVSVVACVAFEWLYCKLMKKANPIGDLSAVVTGIILALNVPVGMPIGEGSGPRSRWPSGRWSSPQSAGAGRPKQ